MAILGPNCQGAVNFSAAFPLYSDAVSRYAPGNVALISQSGSVTTALINNRRGVRWSHAVSSGNEACVDAADLLDYFVGEPEVDMVCAFLETVRFPERFFAACRLAHEAGKAVIVCKSGRTKAAQRAAAAHSGALASPDRLVDALLRSHHVIRADSLSELLETAKAVGSGARPRGPRVAAVSGSGGHISLLLDEVHRTSLTVPAFDAPTEAHIGTALARERAIENPVDYFDAPRLDEALPRVMSILAEDENVDLLLAIVDFSVGPTGLRPRARRLLDAWERSSPRAGRVLFLLDAVGGTPDPEMIEEARQSNVVILSELSVGLKALQHLVDHSAVDAPSVDAAPEPHLDAVEAILSRATLGINSGELPLSLVAAAGIPTVPTMVFARAERLDERACELDFPVVAKVADPSLAHKAQVGGVVLGIRSVDELARAVSRLRTIGDGAVMVQPQLTSDVELLAGLHSSPGLGTFVMLGVGGVHTELIDDVVIRPLGLKSGEASALIRELRVYDVLASSLPAPESLSGVVDVISRLDRLGRAVAGRIQSLDINPLLVTAHGAIAVYALLVV